MRLLLILSLCLGSALPSSQADVEKDLNSKDVAVRLDAVRTLAAEGGEGAAPLLLDALEDDDWEVCELAARALADHPSERARFALLEAALEGPIRRTRLAAATSLGRMESRLPEALRSKRSLARLLAKERRKHELRVLEAICALIPLGEGGRMGELILDGLGSKEIEVRVQAARAIAGLSASARAVTLRKLARDDDLRPICAALDGMRATPCADLLSLLLELNAAEDLDPVVSRRIVDAVVHAVLSAPTAKEREAAVEQLLAKVSGPPHGEVGSRFARILARLGDIVRPEEPLPSDAEPAEPGETVAPTPPDEELRGLPDADELLLALEPLLTYRDPATRATAAWALGVLATPRARSRAARLASDDEVGRVRLHAVRAAGRDAGIAQDDVYEAITTRIREDAEPTVREQACVLLGRKGLAGTVGVLTRAVDEVLTTRRDPDWALAVSALVSLGKTEDPGAVEVLARVLQEAKDWRLRGAAVVGLGRVRNVAAIPLLIKAMGDKSTSVTRTAYEFLRRLPPREVRVEPRKAAWAAWWKKNENRFEFVDWDALARREKRHGYAVTRTGVYEGLDVVVMVSRGDHIEHLLDDLGVEYRRASPGQIAQAQPHPFSLYVSNCTGEGCSRRDFEQLAWFVRVGGYLFNSCWALKHTVENVAPGVIRKFATTQGNVLGVVHAFPCAPGSPYLEGVFDGVTQPMYVLEGAYLIEVLDSERAEVLIDSPQAAQTWGSGELCAFFDVGHGVILDSVNHFDLQGLARAPRLKTAEDRMAWAMDHMGMNYAEVRQLAAEGIWKKRGKATERARDLSAFRLISNFVRAKRLRDP